MFSINSYFKVLSDFLTAINNFLKILNININFESVMLDIFTNINKLLDYQNFYLIQLLALNNKPIPIDQDFTFNIIKNNYIAITNSFLELINREISPNLDHTTSKKLIFYTKFFFDALNPRNFPFYDPAFRDYTIQNNFVNLFQGFQNFLDDLQDKRFHFTQENEFILGDNIACTPGKIVFRNELFELICYKPMDSVHQIPILLVPAIINKYYILDLGSQNSLIQWLINRNMQVFVVSWINPTLAEKDFDFTKYIIDGVNKAIETIIDFGYEKINLCGYCIGGIFTAISASIFADKNKPYINSLSFLATHLNFTEPNFFSIFLEEETWANNKEEAMSRGIVSGLDMQYFFNFIRAKDMIWQYIIDNYYYNKPKSKLDILYWNSDSTNLTSKFYCEYLEHTYLHNLVVKQNQLEIAGYKIHLDHVTVPCFFLATINDHIVPWEDAYNSMKSFNCNCDKTFILGGSGHIAGIVNPPTNNKYKFWINKDLKLNHEEWLVKATEYPGSWWETWGNWLETKANGNISSKYENLPNLGAAPGDYVKVRI